MNKDDHSKWVISEDNAWVCGGDMNRMTSQGKRGGAFLCFQDQGLWGAMKKSVVEVEECGARNFLE